MRPPLEQMQSSGKHLLSLINNVLDLAKIEANKMELALADYAVPDMVGMVRSTLQSLATEKGLELVVSVPEDLPLAHGDGDVVEETETHRLGGASVVAWWTDGADVITSYSIHYTKLYE